MSLFGNTGNSVFGGGSAPATGGSLFGGSANNDAPTSGGIFGGGSAAPASGGNLFGGSSAAPASGNLFGGNAAPASGGNLFGGSSDTPAAPPTGGNLFGGSSAPAPSGGIFGGNAASSPPPAAEPTSGGIFGGNAAQSNSNNLFGGGNAIGSSTRDLPFGSPLQGNSAFTNTQNTGRADEPNNGVFQPGEVIRESEIARVSDEPTSFAAPGASNSPQNRFGASLFSANNSSAQQAVFQSSGGASSSTAQARHSSNLSNNNPPQNGKVVAFPFTATLPAGVFECTLKRAVAEDGGARGSGNLKKVKNPIFHKKPLPSPAFRAMHEFLADNFQLMLRFSNHASGQNKPSEAQAIRAIDNYSQAIFDRMEQARKSIQQEITSGPVKDRVLREREADQLQVGSAVWELCHLLMLGLESVANVPYLLCKWYVRNYLRDEVAQLAELSESCDEAGLWALVLKFVQLDLQDEAIRILEKIPSAHPQLILFLNETATLKEIAELTLSGEMDYAQQRLHVRRRARELLNSVNVTNGGNGNAEKLLKIFAGESVVAETWVEEVVFRFIWCAPDFDSNPTLADLLLGNDAVEKYRDVELNRTDEIFLKIFENDHEGLIATLANAQHIVPMAMVIHLIDLLFLSGVFVDENVREFYFSEYACYLMDITLHGPAFSYFRGCLVDWFVTVR